MTKKMTAREVVQKYKGKWIDVHECPSWDENEKGERQFEVRKVYEEIHENSTQVLDEDFINNY